MVGVGQAIVARGLPCAEPEWQAANDDRPLNCSGHFVTDPKLKLTVEAAVYYGCVGRVAFPVPRVGTPD